METLNASGTGVKAKHVVVFGVAHYFEYVRVPADKYLWGANIQHRLHPARKAGRIATNVGYPYIHPFNTETIIQRVFGAHIVPINVAIDCSYGFKGFQLLNNGNVANIACMPYFINIFKVLKHLRVEVAVGIGYKAYAGHGVGLVNLSF